MNRIESNRIEQTTRNQIFESADLNTVKLVSVSTFSIDIELNLISSDILQY